MRTLPARRKPSLVQESMSHPDAMIDMHEVVKTFKNAAGEFTVLKGIDLTIQRGEFVSIVGKSGSGKSTLLNMITGIDHPTSGRVIIGGTDIYTGVTESQRSRWRGRNLGIVFQFFQLLPMLTLLENVMLAMDFAELYDFDERPGRAMDMLKLVGLERFANKLPVLVSTGQQQLAAIARALACDPPLLVADEPTGNLDTKSANTIIDLFEELARRGKTVVMVTHDPSLTSRTTRNIIISDGELINEAIARALPWLRHRHMLEFTRLARFQSYPADTVIASPQDPMESLFIIQSGEADVISYDRRSNETVLSHLKPGDFFGENEILNRKKTMISIRAGSQGPVDVLTIPRDDFQRVLDESPITAGAVGRIVQERSKVYQTANHRKFNPFSLFRKS